MEYLNSEALYLLFLIIPLLVVKMFLARLILPWRHWRFLSLLLSFALLVVAISGPFYSVARASRAFMLIFDISRSMTVEDMKNERGTPLSRLDFAKNEVAKIIPFLPAGTRIGVGSAVVWSDFEFSANANIKIFWPIQQIKEEKAADIYRALAIVDWWNAWGDKSRLHAFIVSLQWLAVNRYIPPKTTVIIFSDGGEQIFDNQEDTILSASQELKNKDIRMVFVGVGGSLPRTVPDFDEQLKKTGECFINPVTWECFQSALDENNLRNLAVKLNGRYQRLSGSADLVSVFADENNPIAGEEKVRRDVSWIFVLGSIIFLIFCFI